MSSSEMRGSHSRPVSIRRPVGGAVALIVALLLMLIVPRMLQPDVVGQARAAPLPQAPAIGTCIVTDPNSTAITPVPCDEPHDGEVAWAAVSRSANQSLTGSYEALWAAAADPVAAAASSCAGWAQSYVGSGIADPANVLGSWLPIPPYWVSVIERGPSADLPQQWGWYACVVRPSNGETYVDSVRADGAELSSRRPGSYATCLAPGEAAIRLLQFSSCGQPHQIEFMATLVVTEQMAATGRIDAEVSKAQLLAQCESAVTQMTGNPDPTYGGQLMVTVESVSQRGLPTTESDQAAPGEQLIRPDCLVELRGDGLLIGSVIGLGPTDLPLA